MGTQVREVIPERYFEQLKRHVEYERQLLAQLQDVYALLEEKEQEQEAHHFTPAEGYAAEAAGMIRVLLEDGLKAHMRPMFASWLQRYKETFG